MMTADRPKLPVRPRSCPGDPHAGASWPFIHGQRPIHLGHGPEGFESIAGAARPLSLSGGGPPTPRQHAQAAERLGCRANRLTSPARGGALDISTSEDDAGCAIIAHLRCRKTRRAGEDEGEGSAIGDPHAPANSAHSLAIWWRRSTRHRGPCFTGPGTAHLLVVRLGGYVVRQSPERYFACSGATHRRQARSLTALLLSSPVDKRIC